jgi:hypothetical protein
MDIRWFDGQDAKNKFVLEMMFKNNGLGYLKNESYEKISGQYDFFWDNDQIVGMTLYNPEGKVVATKYRNKAAA